MRDKMSTSVFTASTRLFEFNDVFASTYDVRQAAYNEFLGQFGFTGNQEEFELLIGSTDRQIVNHIKVTYNLEQELTDLDEFYFLLKKKNFDEGAKLIDGALDCIKFFKSQNFSLGLVTYSSKDIINGFLEQNDLRKLFDFMTTGDKISTGKPNPEIYINSLSKFDSTDMSVFIIESSRAGITAGYKAGIIKIIGIGPKPKHIELMKAGAMVAVENLKELQNLPWTYG